MAINAFKGFGRYSLAANAGVAAAALTAPALLKSDDRGYAQTAAVTTPLIGAGYLAAPGMIGSFRTSASEFGDFWKKNPFHLTDYPKLNSTLRGSGGRVRSAMADYAASKEAGFFAGAGSAPEVISNRPIDFIRGLQNRWDRKQLKDQVKGMSPSQCREFVASWNQSEQQRRFLSNAVYEAEFTSLTPEQAIARANIVPQPLSVDELAARVEANKTNPRFMRVMESRARQAENVRLGRSIPHAQNIRRTADSLDVATAITELQMKKAGFYVRKAEWVQAAIDAGQIGSGSRIAFSLQDGLRSQALGAIIYDKQNRNRFLLPFTHEGNPAVYMGEGFRQMGTSTGVIDNAGRHAADDYLLAHLGQPFYELEQEARASFQYGGINDPADAVDRFLHPEFEDALLPDWAMKLRQGRYRPAPFGGLGSDGSKKFEELSLNQQADFLLEQRNRGLTWIGPEGKATEGYLQEGEVALASPEIVPTLDAQDAFYRSMTKPIHFDQSTLYDVSKVRIENEALKDLVGHAQSELPMFQAKLGLVSPQMKSLLGDIPEEAETAIRKAYDHEQEMGIFEEWRQKVYGDKDFGEFYQDLYTWHQTDEFRKFESIRRREAMAWWEGEAGQAYNRHVRSTLSKMSPNATPEQIEQAVSAYRNILSTSPEQAAEARRFMTVGEMSVVADEQAFAGVKGEMNSVLNLKDLNIPLGTKGEIQAGTVIGYKPDGMPVLARKGMSVKHITETDTGFAAYLDREFDFAGAKISAGFGGPKGMVTTGNVHSMVDFHNEIVEKLGVGTYLPHDVNMLSVNAVTSLKSKTHYADLMENAAELSAQMVDNVYTLKGRMRAQQFLDELTEGGYSVSREGGKLHVGFDPRRLATEQDRITHITAFSRKAQQFLDDTGQIALENPSMNHPLLDAFRRSAAPGRREGLTLSEYMNRAFNYTPVMMWDHAAINIPANVKVTYDMLDEMKRAGSVHGIRDILSQTLRTKGDPAMTWKMAEHLREGDFTKQIGNVLPIGDIHIPQGRLKVDDRVGRSVFNPALEEIQDNFSVDLGTVLKDVEFAGGTTDLQYLPKLGMNAYLGHPNQHNDIWQSTQLENLYNDTIQTVDALKKAPTEALKTEAKKRAGKYLDALTGAMVGKEGVLRAEGLHQNATYGVAVARSTGPGGANPFDVFLSEEALGQFDEGTANAIRNGEDVYGAMFRDPVSAAYNVRFRHGASHEAALDAYEIGVDTRLSGPYQMDHDKDLLKLVAFKDEAAIAEAKAAMQEGSLQWQNLKASEAFQGMEDPRQISDLLMEQEYAEKGWRGSKSWLTELENNQAADALLKTKRQKILNRLTFGFTGRYSNATTKMNLLLSNNPHMKPGDADFALLNKLNFYIRQVTISSAKGKMSLGENPEALLNELNSAINMGESGAERARQVLYKTASEAGFKTVYDQSHGQTTGVTHLMERMADGTFRPGAALEKGKVYNLGANYLATDRGLGAVRKMLANPNRGAINQVSQMLVSNQVSAERAKRMLDAAAQGNVSNELFGGIAGRTAPRSAWVDMAYKVDGRVGSAAEDISHKLGAVNQGLKDAFSSGKGGFQSAGKVLGWGLGAAAVAGILTTSLRSSNEDRPEEKIATAEHVPGEPIAGSRASVNPKRQALPAPRGVKTMVVAPMQQSVNLDVRAKAEDRSGQMELAKMVERMAGSGTTNVTVNRVGGWKDSVSRLRNRERIKDELNRY